MFRAKWSILLFSILIPMFVGCGYTFGNLLLNGERKLELSSISNITEFSCDFIMESALSDSFSNAGIRIRNISSDRSRDGGVLVIRITDALKKASMFNEESKPLQYRISFTVEYEFKEGEEILKEGKITDHGYYYPERDTKNREDDAIEEAFIKISVKIVDNCLDRW